ncbi:MAG: ERAP1-like C-terminal domain-containing protein, partial [Micrococcus sp.]|nr:ERAP1-like C-terminal domain-containing protein [Micrococcus sp.]
AALWSMVRDGELAVRAFIEALERLGESFREVGTYQMVMTQSSHAIARYAAPADRLPLRLLLASVLRRHVRDLEPGGDRQRIAARLVGLVARDDADVARDLAADLAPESRDDAAPGLVVDAEMQWLVLQARAATGQVQREELDAVLAEHRTAQTVVWHTVAVHARQDARVKEAAFTAALTGTDADGAALSNDLLSATAEGFSLGSRELTQPYDLRLFDELEQIWSSRSNGLASRTIVGLFPGHQDALPSESEAQDQHPVLAAAQSWLDEHVDAPAALRRVMIEETDGLRRSLRVQALQH